MRCSKAKKLIIQHIDGALGAAASARLERHFEGCPECGRYREEVAKIVHSLRSAPEPEKSEAFWNSFSESVGRRLRQAESTRSYRPALPSHRSPLLRPALALVSVAVVLITVAAYFFPGRQAPPALPEIEYEALMTMFDDDSFLNLPATAALNGTPEDFSEYYENVEIPAGFFNGRHGILRGATPADIVEEISESELEEIYKGLVET